MEPFERPDESLDSAYFEKIYATTDDPWDFRSSGYERAKYADTLASLPRERYRRAFEIGCSNGELSARLIPRVGELLSVDLNERALAAARRRNARADSVRFERLQFPSELPEGSFDLIVVSEVAYYWGRADFEKAQRLLHGLLEPGGDLMLVHYTPEETDYPMTGDEVHESFLGLSRQAGGAPWRHLTGHRHARYRLDAFRRC